MLPGEQTGAGVLTTLAWTWTFADALVVFADEVNVVAPNPTRARTTTKLRIAMFFICSFLLKQV